MSKRGTPRQPVMDTKQDLANLAVQIQWWRKESGLSKRELGRRAGFSTSAVTRLEKHNSNPRWSTIVALSKALGMESPYILIFRTPFERPNFK